MNTINTINTISFILVYFILTIPIHAQDDAADFSGATTAINVITDAVSGGLGIAIATLAVVGVGLAFTMGKMDWMFASSAIVAIVILFSATAIVSSFTGLMPTYTAPVVEEPEPEPEPTSQDKNCRRKYESPDGSHSHPDCKYRHNT